VPPGLSNVVAIAVGFSHSLALKDDGTVVAWGGNWEGQATVPPGLSNVVAIAAGANHSLALKADGTVVAWGNAVGSYPNYGQSVVPPGLSNVKAIAAGESHSLALVFDGPPEILEQPGNVGVAYQSNIVLSVTARGFEPLGYRWFFNGSALTDTPRIFGTTNASLIISNTQFSDIGTYQVIVSNALGSVQSSGAVLTVISPPFITSQSPDRTVGAGADVTLAVSAGGTPPLSYQWSFNGTNLPGKTFSAFSFSNVQPSDSGIYSLRVINVYGSAQADIRLTVTNTAPYILQQPYVRQSDQSTVTNPVVPIGSSVTFNVGARGSLPLNYQWRINGTDILNATNLTLALANLRMDQTGFYSVAIRNAFGEVVSAKAFLNVVQVMAWGNPFPTGTTIPVGLSGVTGIAAGGSHVLTLKSDGTVKPFLAESGYVFDQTIYLTNVPPFATNFVALAAGRTHNVGLRPNGTVVAWGNNSLGQTNVPAGLSNVMAIAAGWNHTIALRSNGTLAIWGNGAPTSVPADVSNVVAVAAGGTHNLVLKQDGTVRAWGLSGSPTNVPPSLSNVIAIAASSTHNLALKSDGKVAGWAAAFESATNVPVGLSNVVAIAAGPAYSLALKADGTITEWGSVARKQPPALSNVVAIAAGGVQSGFGVALIGDGSPVFTIQPSSRTATNGVTVQFHGRAVGVQPLGYQWQLEGIDLPVATNASLIITNVQGKNTGGYRLLVSNALGSAISTTAQLTIPFSTNLTAALNATNLSWNNEFTPAWFAQVRVTHDGDVAAQSGKITNNQQSVLQTSVSGPGTLTFWWKVSSEEGYDFLRFAVNGTLLASVSGDNDWQQKTFALASGTQVLRWNYVKDASVSTGQDAAWLDEVVFTPTAPIIERQPFSQIVPLGANVTIPAVASGPGALTYQWLKNGTNLFGATAPYLTLTNVARRDSASYALRVSNAAGSVTSSNATLKVIVRQQLSGPRPMVDGSVELTSRDADGGSLLPQDFPAFEVLASTNLADWVVLPDVLSLTNGSLLVRDPAVASLPRRFYRMVEH
jgi:alpha-tubulin suppressor-like RCC1 family protein